jgi:hypothetical protein
MSVISLFSHDGLERLKSYADYRFAKPFPHLILDGLFDPNALRAILDEWPCQDSTIEAHNDGTFVRNKLGTSWRTPFGRVTAALFKEMAGPLVLQALQEVTGMWGLMGDPYMFGGGLHATSTGGTLAVHADFNKHPIFKLDRRLNLLIYLNYGWTDDNGGWLELWEGDMSRCARRVLPVFNRTVIFSTNSTSYHGQPHPIIGPPDLWRRSIALYYYSNGRADEGNPSDASDSHSTLWQKSPEVDF